ncbi:ankyrin repeat-containing domain protein [Coprinopsis sp. MPI-PUGE-AT-0042]|nr:ankyrin repeat-containing domain protein [Coprinopsis sp. MPI-PUGE-AT-0042]
MAEKDPTARLRRAVKENNLFLVKRLIQRTDMRNPDPAPRRYTSLAWAAVLGHEETFEFLLTSAHDEHELSKDSENNTILMLLADQKPPSTSHYSLDGSAEDSTGATLRMARMYFDRYTWTLDWSNIHGKTALHIAALRGNEELVRIVQVLIERGCQYNVKNNEGFTPLDYAYSTREALQETVRLQYDINKEKRRHIYAQAAARGTEMNRASPISIPPPVPSKDHDINSRFRSGSGTSRTTHTSDSGDIDGFPGQASLVSSASSRPSTGSSPLLYNQGRQNLNPSSGSSGYASTKGPIVTSPLPTSALSPIASRMRERDADAMEKYLRRNRSESSSTDNPSINGSTTAAGSGQLSAGLPPTAEEYQRDKDHQDGAVTPRRLRPSYSAAQLRSTQELPEPSNGAPHSESRSRSGTNPTSTRTPASPLPTLTRAPSISNSAKPGRTSYEESKNYMGPPSQYAKFPEPPARPRPEGSNSSANSSRRKALHILGFDSSNANHRRGLSATSVRGS